MFKKQLPLSIITSINYSIFLVFKTDSNRNTVLTFDKNLVTLISFTNKSVIEIIFWKMSYLH